MYYIINDDFSAACIRVPGSIPPESTMGNPKNPAENSERPTDPKNPAKTLRGLWKTLRTNAKP
jgi:hypothetical protein